MRDHSLEKEMTDMHAKNLAVQFLIENSHTIFSAENPLRGSSEAERNRANAVF